jgi:hypothetical protein
MPTYNFIVRFSWTAGGIANVRAAGERRRTSILAAHAAGIRVLHHSFVLDGKDDIEWSAAVDNVASPAAAQALITNLWNTVFLTFPAPGPYVTAPRLIIQI